MCVHETNATSGQRQNHSTPEKLPAPCRQARSYLARGSTVVELHGTIDLSTIPEIQLHTDAATARPGVCVVVDLRPVDFFDCSTLGLLCRTRRRALERGGHLILVCAHPWHLRILQAAGVGTLFAPLATVEDALQNGH
ncbi:STAS domain-containing protein [Streptomyces aurantiacus]|uniref:Anti-sigma factor antagonist n=1 Tax=Streptomyces aurantiacus TaxID=47760 RepID=A0A7G1P6I3_9ACTN|nr:STAS domain-containing protein [Streptomyces aurantiacus]BCL28665.1 hypothetical protein GCM10017557_35240 [Streptomyces aurantiacus]